MENQLSPLYMHFPARKFVRWANDEDKKNIVDSQTIDYERI